MATSFGLCTALSRRDFPPDGFIGSFELIAVENVMNCIMLDSDRIWQEELAHAGVLDAQITRWKVKFEAADLKLIKF